MRKKTRLINGDEQDAVHARHLLCSTHNHPAVVKFAKRKINKRERRIGKREAKDE